MCFMPAMPLRSTCGPASRKRSGSQVSQTCGGSTTWSSTLTIIGIVGVSTELTGSRSLLGGRPLGGGPSNLTGRHIVSGAPWPLSGRGPYGEPMAHDLVVRGGNLVDGTGAPGTPADVAIDGDRITA